MKVHDAEQPWGLVVALGVTELVAWGSVYYSFAMLMEPLQGSLGASKAAVVGAFSVALLASGLCAPLIGGFIDRHGGRGLMAAGSVLAGLGLCALAHVETVAQLYIVCAALGMAMAATLYEPAFVVLTQAFRTDARRAISAVTLFGGLASTVFWPVTATLITEYGWRHAMLALGAVQLVVCLPLHLLAIPRSRPAAPRRKDTDTSTSLHDVLRDRTFYLLCLAFISNALVFSAMGIHMLAMLEDKGMSVMQAAWVGAMLGPMSVLGRTLEMAISHRMAPSRVGIIAMSLLPASLALFLVADGSLLLFFVFALLYGVGNGAMTIVRGTIPAELYGRARYGAVNGAMALPVFVARAAGPIAAAFLWGAVGGYDGVVVVLAVIAVGSTLSFVVAVRLRRSTTLA